jgi:WD40 repeat protein
MKIAQFRDSGSKPPRCAYCHEQLDRSPFVCEKCRTYLHADCARALAVCPTLGCATPFRHRRLARTAATVGMVIAVALLGLAIGRFLPRTATEQPLSTATATPDRAGESQAPRTTDTRDDVRAPDGPALPPADELARITEIPTQGGVVQRLAFSPMGDRLAAVGENPTMVPIFATYSGAILATIPGASGTTWSFEFSLSGNELAFGGSGGAKVRDVTPGRATPEQPWDIVVPRAALAEVAYCRGHDEIAVSCPEAEIGIAVWSTKTRTFDRTVGDGLAFFSATYIHRGDMLVANEVKTRDNLVFSRATGKLICRLTDGGNPKVAGSPSHDLVATAEPEPRRLRLWSLPEGRVVRTVSYPGALPPWDVDFSPDGRLLAVAAWQRVDIYSMPDGDRVFSWSAPEGSGHKCLAFSPRGDLLAIGAIGRVVLYPVSLLRDHADTTPRPWSK